MAGLRTIHENKKEAQYGSLPKADDANYDADEDVDEDNDDVEISEIISERAHNFVKRFLKGFGSGLGVYSGIKVVVALVRNPFRKRYVVVCVLCVIFSI